MLFSLLWEVKSNLRLNAGVDLGCLFWIPDPIPDTGFRVKKILVPGSGST
jgi:hypothetical protein